MRVSNFGIFARKRTNMLASQGENARLDTKMRTGRRKYARTHTEMHACKCISNLRAAIADARNQTGN
jgi:hypothetical protein